ncbi:MAG: hypothetical protein ACO2OQ_01070 [Thermofilaceae archaeon]
MRGRRARRGQILVVTVLIVGIIIMALLVNVYQMHTLFLRTRSPVVREVVAAVTADFKRALAAMLALATRAYFNYTEFSDLAERFASYGMSMYNRHNFTVARLAALTFLEYWRRSAIEAYGAYGLQVSYELLTLDLSRELGRPRSVKNLMKGYWYLPISGSYAYAKLRLNLTALGFYNWESDVFVGLTLVVNRAPVSVTSTNTTIQISVRFDGDVDTSTYPPTVRGYPYGNLIARGWVRVYYPERDSAGRYTGAWKLAKIKDVTYLGMGNYSITFEPAVEILTDPVTGQRYAPLMVVISDERGIVVEASTYDYLMFAIGRRTPDILIYYDSAGNRRTLARPSDISNEVYTLEMSANLSLYWLGMKLAVDPQLKLPPFPYVPIKQVRVNVSLDGTLSTLAERPIQYENWTTVPWRGVQVDIPVGLADPQMDLVKGDKYNVRLVFQVKFPTTSIRRQYVVLWWYDDLDAEPAAYPTQIQYIYREERGQVTWKDVWHPLYDVEFVDLEHQRSRDYHDYGGVVAFVLRDPVTDFAFGPFNLHAFDVFYGRYLGRYRPYGTWQVYYNYMRYSWIQAPIRIFAILDTTQVGNVYAAGDVRSDYYDTLAIVQVVNGTRYIPVITYIYWKNTRSGYGYWLCTGMGRGYADYFVYTAAGYQYRRNQTFVYTYSDVSGSPGGVLIRPDPGVLMAHWSSGGVGRAVVLNKAAVELLRSIGGSSASFSSTAAAPGGQRQGSIEADFWPYTTSKTVQQGTLLRYWAVLFDFRSSGSGFLSLPVSSAWQNAYIYTPMFLEDYAPRVVRP